ncbi:MoaB/Mog domain-containing protein [Syncephalis plumigaleata]|nr:MoaB/Mog domain-containing protein [Syncephalis plumigaleata]
MPYSLTRLQSRLLFTRKLNGSTYLSSILTRNYTTHTASLCVIGDEILNGKTVDTNSNYLAKWCFGRGIELRRIEVVPDNKEDIGDSVRRLAERYDIVYTCGGIGPTHDDITYESIATAFNLPMALHEPTWKRMRANHPRLTGDGTMTEADLNRRQRMAWQPSGPNVTVYSASEPNLWTPVVVINEQIYIMPGVPILFRRLLDVALPSFLREKQQQPFYRRQIGTRKVESQIADILREEQQKVEGLVKIGSYPYTAKPRVVISLVSRNETALDACLARLLPLLDGYIIQDSNTSDESNST